MNGGHRGVAWPELDALLRDGVAAGLPDGDLLHRFVTSPDRCGELAFTVLVARHGPMVLGVCRRILRDPSEADDAFQATFLVLARKAGSIRAGDSLGPWLYGVSVRVARRLQSVAARRPASATEGEGLGSIPDRHQVRIGGSRAEAGSRGRPGGPAGRLSPCALALLLRRPHARGGRRQAGLPGRHGPQPAGSRPGLASRPARTAGRSGAIPIARAERGPRRIRRRRRSPSLIDSTARAAARLAAGHPLAGVVPARVVEVATGVIRVMARTKWTAAAVVIAIGTLAGWGAWAGQSGPEQGASRGSQREIDTPPSDRLRGDFGRPLQKRIAVAPRRSRRTSRPPTCPPISPPSWSRPSPSWATWTSIRPRSRRSASPSASR